MKNTLILTLLVAFVLIGRLGAREARISAKGYAATSEEGHFAPLKSTRHPVGDLAGVGCLVNACGECEERKAGDEQYCSKRVLAYGARDPFHGDEFTQGGYSNNIVVSENFAIKVPAVAELEKVAPLLCAGITTCSPIRLAKVGKGDKSSGSRAESVSDTSGKAV